MRILALTLVAANLVLLIWILARPAATDVDDRSGPGVRLPFDIDRLRLLSETGADGRSAPDLARGFANPVCARAGPLADREDGEAVVTRAMSLGMAASLAPVDLRTGPPDLQVHLPPFPSPDRASGAVRELAALGMEAFVIAEGAHAGAVSVGVFTERDTAEARLREVSGLGYEVRIVEIQRTRRVWDLLLESADLESLDAFLLGVRADWPELSGDRIDCPAVAASEQGATSGAGGP